MGQVGQVRQMGQVEQENVAKNHGNQIQLEGSCANGILCGSFRLTRIELAVFCIFMQHDIRPVLKIYSKSMVVAEDPLNLICLMEPYKLP